MTQGVEILGPYGRDDIEDGLFQVMSQTDERPIRLHCQRYWHRGKRQEVLVVLAVQGEDDGYVPAGVMLGLLEPL